MREGRSRQPAEPGWGWLGAVSLLLAVVGAFLLVIGWAESFAAGLSGARTRPTAFVAGAAFGLASVLVGVVGWLNTRGRGAVRGWTVLAALVGGLVLVAGGRGAYENSRPPAECRNWESIGAGSERGWNVLNGVAATSSSNAWAVGRCSGGGPERTLILHWDGSNWGRQRSPNVGWGINALSGVAATSPSNAWAVGGYAPEGSTYYLALILHWDGTRWSRQPSPTADEPADLTAVTATSDANAWAVGSDNAGALILRWDGTRWSREPLPQLGPGIYPYLHGAAATSATSAWAVGSYGYLSDGPVRGVIFHWDGTEWTSQAVPHVGTGDNVLTAVSARSPSDVWVVGWQESGAGRRALILHWDGETWASQPNLQTSADVELQGVTSISSSDAWAVGSRGMRSFVLCWNGAIWEERPSPNVGTDHNILNGVAAISSAEALAVGIGGDGTAARALVPSCRGS